MIGVNVCHPFIDVGCLAFADNGRQYSLGRCPYRAHRCMLAVVDSRLYSLASYMIIHF